MMHPAVSMLTGGSGVGMMDPRMLEQYQFQGSQFLAPHQSLQQQNQQLQQQQVRPFGSSSI